MDYPLGHRQRHNEALPLLHKKIRNNTSNYHDKDRRELILAQLDDSERFDAMTVSDFMQQLPAKS